LRRFSALLIRGAARLFLVVWWALRPARREVVAAALVFSRHIARALVLGISAMLSAGCLLRLYLGVSTISATDSYVAAAAALFPGISGSAQLVPPLASIALGIGGWILIGLWLGPMSDLFKDWREYVAAGLEANVKWVRTVTRTTLSFRRQNARVRRRMREILRS
jgi:hypothetical protein